MLGCDYKTWYVKLLLIWLFVVRPFKKSLPTKTGRPATRTTWCTTPPVRTRRRSWRLAETTELLSSESGKMKMELFNIASCFRLAAKLRKLSSRGEILSQFIRYCSSSTWNSKLERKNYVNRLTHSENLNSEFRIY